MKNDVNIFLFRRDLRLNDNAGLFHALNSGLTVLPIFIFDKIILDKLKRNDSRVTFIYDQVLQLKKELENNGSSLLVFYDSTENTFQKLITKFNIKAVYINKDYEPYARERDSKIRNVLESNGAQFYAFKDHVIFEENKISSE